jgi:excisionase family DNA binding protein
MVTATQPSTRSITSLPSLVGTYQASRQLRVPSRTVRRWVQQRRLGMVVAGRTVLSPEDLRMLQLLRDGGIG